MMKEFFNQADQKAGAQLIAEMEDKIARYARVPHYVLILGERGTGKTTIAKRLHEQSARAKKEFVNLNCASLSQELLEAELFGYEKGAFTGASAPKMGLFEIANGGTLFLDEIGEIPFVLQAKLLKAVEEKRIRRVGSNIERPVDTRIIAATSQNLKEMVEKRIFRADLLDRLNILVIETVPLRLQKEKIEELTQKGLNEAGLAIGHPHPFEISPDALLLLESHDWHGNFRELLNCATRLAVECFDDSVISAAAVRQVLGDKLKHPSTDNFENFDEGMVTVTFDPKIDDLDQIYLKAAGNVIQHILTHNEYNLRRAARTLKADHSTLSRILKKFNGNMMQFSNQIPSSQTFAVGQF